MMARLQNWWQAEAGRHFLWLPVCFGAGVGLYLGLPQEPPVYLLLSVFLAALVVTLLLWRRARPPVIALLALAGGLFWASLITQWTPQRVLHEALGVRTVLGTVNDIVRTEHGYRFTLDHLTIDELQPERTPNQIRLSIRLKKDAEPPELPHIGDAIRIRAGLRPPMGPVLPHGFDFARYFYFRDIGAVGYGLPPWKVVGRDTAPGYMTEFRDWRVRITEDIIRTLGPETGGVGAGLITGDARAISEADFDALRASNLYHIIAISGEHMVVIAGVIFVTLRLLALLLPRRISHRPQVKTIAAAITLLLVTAYLFVTGLPVSAVRAYVMIFLVLMAVILRRRVNAMRSLALTALIMLVADPAVLIEPGFQLSFAATLAIIALIEAALLRPDAQAGRIRKAFRLLLTMLCISIVAEIATTPLVIAQFNNVSLYGVFANMLATPIVSLYLMPTVALYFILLPFGLHHVALWWMDWGIRALLGLSQWVASFPHAQMFVPSIPGYGVALFALGLLWVCLWQTRARYAGVLAMVLGVATVTTNHAPDLLIGEQLKQIAFRTDAGYVLARGRPDSMIPSLWANGLGYNELPEADKPAWRCDRQGCVAQVKGRVIAFPIDPSALAEDCLRAQIILTSYDSLKCPSAAVEILDTQMLEGSNVTAFWFGEVTTRRESSADWQGKRPWSATVAEEEDED